MQHIHSHLLYPLQSSYSHETGDERYLLYDIQLQKWYSRLTVQVVGMRLNPEIFYTHKSYWIYKTQSVCNVDNADIKYLKKNRYLNFK